MASDAVIPTRVTPLQNAVVTALPTMTATCADAQQTSVQVFARIKDMAGRIVNYVELPRTTGSTYSKTLTGPGTTGQKITIKYTGATVPGRGTFRVWLFGAYVELPWNASATQTREAIEKLPDLAPGDVEVAGRIVETTGITITMAGARVGVSYALSAQRGWLGQSLLLPAGVGSPIPVSTTVVSGGGGDLPRTDEGTGTAYGQWQWDAVSLKSGVWFSGRTQSSRSATSGGNWPWWYSPLPTLSIATPTAGQVVARANPTTTWTVGGSSDAVPVIYQEIVLEDAANGYAPVFVRSTATTRPDGTKPPTAPRAIHAGALAGTYTFDASYIANPGSYRETIRITNAAGQTAVTTRSFSVAYSPPDPVASFGGALSGDRTLVTLTWAASTSTSFSAYRVFARRGGFVGTEEWRQIARITSKTTTTLTTADWAFNEPVQFAIQVEADTGDVVQSALVTWDLPAVSQSGTVLTTLDSPPVSVILPARRDRDITYTAPRLSRTPWGQATPVISTNGREYYRTIQCSYPYLEDDPTTGTRALDEFAKVLGFFRDNTLVFYRDAKQAMYGRITGQPVMHDIVDFNYLELEYEFTEQGAPGEAA